MLSAGAWKQNQPNTILFVMVDTDGAELSGLDDNLDISISKGGQSFAVGVGTAWEVGSGWYAYTATVEEADTSGPLAVVVTAVGAMQQNLEYVVDDRVITAISYTYTLTSTVGNVPVAGAKIEMYLDAAGQNIVWSGTTDALGVARDGYGALPRLEPGTYYIWRTKAGFTADNPDVEIVSA